MWCTLHLMSVLELPYVWKVKKGKKYQSNDPIVKEVSFFFNKNKKQSSAKREPRSPSQERGTAKRTPWTDKCKWHVYWSTHCQALHQKEKRQAQEGYNNNGRTFRPQTRTFHHAAPLEHRRTWHRLGRLRKVLANHNISLWEHKILGPSE